MVTAWREAVRAPAPAPSTTGSRGFAEALAERAEATRRAEQLRARVVDSARYQGGETPAEDAAQLPAEAGEVLDALETLIRRINRTNATVEMGPDGTLTDALARRDVLRSRHSVVTAAADAAAGKGEACPAGFHAGTGHALCSLRALRALQRHGSRGSARAGLSPDGILEYPASDGG